MGNERLSWRLRDIIALTVLAIWGALHLTEVIMPNFRVPPQVDQAMLIILAWWPTSAVVEVAISHRHPKRERRKYIDDDGDGDGDEALHSGDKVIVVKEDESNASA